MINTQYSTQTGDGKPLLANKTEHVSNQNVFWGILCPLNTDYDTLVCLHKWLTTYKPTTAFFEVQGLLHSSYDLESSLSLWLLFTFGTEQFALIRDHLQKLSEIEQLNS